MEFDANLTMNWRNLLLNTDSYKPSHWLQYPDKTETVYSYIESRGCDLGWEECLFFGLQGFIMDYLMKPFTQQDIDEAEEFIAYHMEGVPADFVWGSGPVPRVYDVFNKEGWEYILKEHGGYLPIRIKAVKEGTVVPLKNVLVTVENTDPKCYWLTSYVETAILRAVWYPTTVATQSWRIKQILRDALEKTCDIPEIILPSRLHDFGGRGVSSFESAAIGGASHLVNFVGSDTITGALWARRFYGAKMAAFSIAAGEHSTLTAEGEEGEVNVMDRMLDKFAKPGAFVAIVSDSYDIYRACSDYWGGKLKEKVLASGATIIVRPDSGDPVIVPIDCINILDQAYGHETNKKGYDVLIATRAIQGDGTTEKMIYQTITKLMDQGWSIENIAFGMGGALLQKCDRDTLKWAMKNCWMLVDGVGRDIFKKPVTDTMKHSKRGRLALVRVKETGEFKTVAEHQLIGNNAIWEDMLETVFENGKLIRKTSFDEVRANADTYRKEIIPVGV